MRSLIFKRFKTKRTPKEKLVIVELIVVPLVTILLVTNVFYNLVNEGKETKHLKAEEKTSYISIFEMQKAYNTSTDDAIKKDCWIVVDPKNGNEYFFRQNRLTPRKQRNGEISVNENWLRKHPKQR